MASNVRSKVPARDPNRVASVLTEISLCRPLGLMRSRTRDSVRNVLRLRAVLDVFSQVREDRSDLCFAAPPPRQLRHPSVSPGINRTLCRAQGIMCAWSAAIDSATQPQQGSHQTPCFVGSFLPQIPRLPVLHSELNRCQESAELCRFPLVSGNREHAHSTPASTPR